MAGFTALLAVGGLAVCGSPPGEDRAEGGASAEAGGAVTADSAAAAADSEVDKEPAVGTAGAAACGDITRERGEGSMEDTTRGPGPGIHEVMARHRDAWMERSDVVGTGIGRCEGEPCVVIYLRRRTEEAEDALPDCVEGYVVRLEETGRVTPRGGEDA